MNPQFALGGVMVANAPATAIIAFLLALLVHRLFVALRIYRWVWNPVLFDIALFVVLWALVALTPVLQGSL
ncbi:DUF1656 domain-containing protein [Novosphingobium sp. FKTRR1]|uniref:DUF1656 domain-containing protein n=1 Tax=unclassified Novosphingobium TaxID=2644732 RepID=UPI001CEFFBBA|nr:DUF1656 domain-containing protein [Novosphingobium sp. FKTRR1]